MENNDPFASLTELCQISSSQEDFLRRARFVGKPDDSDSSDDQDESVDIPLENTPIEILSLPESSEEKEHDGCSQQDQFHTPPEGSFLASSQEQQSMHHGHVAGDQFMAIDSYCTDISNAVDLGRDTDLGLSEEVELAQKRPSASGGDSSGGVRRGQENEVIHSELNIIGISNIQSSLNVGSTDSPMRKSVLVTKKLGVKTPTGKGVEKVAKSTEKLKSPAQNHQFSDVMLLDTINDGESIHGESSAKRNLRFRAEAIRSEIEDVSGNSGFAEDIVKSRRNEVDSEVKRMCSNGERDSYSNNIIDLHGCSSTSPSIAEFPGIQRRAKGKRELPVSIAGESVWNARRKNESPKDNPWEYPILYTLRELEKYSNRDTTLEGLSLLEVMKCCGVTFP